MVGTIGSEILCSSEFETLNLELGKISYKTFCNSVQIMKNVI